MSEYNDRSGCLTLFWAVFMFIAGWYLYCVWARAEGAPVAADVEETVRHERAIYLC